MVDTTWMIVVVPGYVREKKHQRVPAVQIGERVVEVGRVVDLLSDVGSLAVVEVWH